MTSELLPAVALTLTPVTTLLIKHQQVYIMYPVTSSLARP